MGPMKGMAIYAARKLSRGHAYVVLGWLQVLFNRTAPLMNMDLS
jgi:hypothetical protein